MRLDLLGNAWPVVGYLDHYLIALLSGPEPDRPSSVHRLDGVVDQVGPHLIQFTAISYNVRQVWRVLPLHMDAFELVTQDGQGVFQSGMHVHFF